MSSNVETAIRTALSETTADAPIYIAYSGGLDSQVLLQITAKLAKEIPFSLMALHLNHGLSENAQAWQKFCEKQCQKLDVSLRIKQLSLDPKQGNLEHRARNARYRWFESFMEKEAVLLTAHHLDDQAETVLLRLMRASGTRGLAAIPASRNLGDGVITRPFLSIQKSELKLAAEQYKLDWIEDESNLSLAFDRNFIRHKVLPALSARWPKANIQLARSADNCRDDQQLIDDLAQQDIQALRVDQVLSILDVNAPLDLRAFNQLSRLRRCNLIQYTVRPYLEYPISQKRLNEWLAQLHKSDADSSCELNVGELALAIYDNKLYCLRTLVDMAKQSFDWCVETPALIKPLNGRLALETTNKIHERSDEVIQLEANTVITIHWREGGERIRLKGEGFTRPLKKVFQANRIAPWLRDGLPLASIDGQIVWSAALGAFSPALVDANANILKIKFIENKLQ